MNYEIIPIEKFKKEAKRLVRKYPSLKSELEELYDVLIKEPRYGTPLGNDAYKIRISIKSKQAGKSGGARVVTYVITEDKEIYLLTIYDKGEFDSIDDATLRKIISNIIDNLKRTK